MLLAISDSIAMFWCGITRPSESVLMEQNDNNRSNENTLTIMRNQASALSNILSDTNLSIKTVGEIIDKGWENKKTLASKITNRTIDHWYSKSLEYGAFGGKISGAGGGGFLTLIVDPKKHSILDKKLEKEGLKRHHIGLDSNGTVVYEIC